MAYGIMPAKGDAGMKKTTLYLPEEMQRGLKDAAKRTGKSEALMIREALAEYLVKQARPWPKSIGMFSGDGSFDARNTKAFLREAYRKKLEDWERRREEERAQRDRE